jgi:hypothetical protein
VRQCQKELPGFFESLIRSILDQIISAMIERASRKSPGAPSLVDALHPINCWSPPLHNAILACWEAISMWLYFFRLRINMFSHEKF